MNQIKIAVAEDNEMLRNAITNLLHTEKDFNVVIQAENGKFLLDRLSSGIKPDVILMDIRMPLMNGIEATRAILKNNPLIKIIAWTIFEDEESVVTMSKLGVKSFLGKKNEEELFKAIRIVHGGGFYIPDQIAEILRKYLERDFAEPCPLNLSGFELTLVKAICKGYSSNDIGKLIGKVIELLRTTEMIYIKNFKLKTRNNL
jgi:DNA-binding NarL/FixJ family response regulator